MYRQTVGLTRHIDITIRGQKCFKKYTCYVCFYLQNTDVNGKLMMYTAAVLSLQEGDGVS